MTIKTKKIPNPGETVSGGFFSTGGGGKGANQAIAAARVGADVSFVARVGDDLLGKEGIKRLNEERINTSYVFRDSEVPTGVAFIVVDIDCIVERIFARIGAAEIAPCALLCDGSDVWSGDA